jgi:hypothetical protein
MSILSFINLQILFFGKSIWNDEEEYENLKDIISEMLLEFMALRVDRSCPAMNLQNSLRTFLNLKMQSLNRSRQHQ